MPLANKRPEDVAVPPRVIANTKLSSAANFTFLRWNLNRPPAL